MKIIHELYGFELIFTIKFNRQVRLLDISRINENKISFKTFHGSVRRRYDEFVIGFQPEE